MANISKLSAVVILTLVLGIFFTGCGPSLEKDKVYVSSSDSRTGKKSTKVRSRYLKLENYSELELLEFINDYSIKNYKLVNYNLPSKYFTITLKTSNKLSDSIYNSIYDSIVYKVFTKDYYKILNTSHSLVQKITDEELLNYTTTIDTPDLIKKMYSGKPKPADGYKPRMMSMNDRYSVWNYTVDEYCSYVKSRMGVKLINETTKPKDEKAYFEYNSNFAPSFFLDTKNMYVHAIGNLAD